MASTDPLPRPRLRGLIHAYAAVGFSVAFVVLLLRSGEARGWITVYAASIIAMLAVSAAYHSGRFSGPALRVLKRVDHSTILLAIAGSYTGVVGLSLEGSTRMWMLVTVWSVAVVGIAIRMLWLGAPYPVVAAVYLAVGWVALVDVGSLVDALTTTQLLLVVAGGVLYSLGAVVYALHAPNPWPRTFGYHEVFHALVVLAAGAHFTAVWMIVLATG